MPIRSRIISRLRIIVSVAEGELTLKDIQHHRDSMLSNPSYDERLRLLFDMRRVTRFDTSAMELRAHADAGAAGWRRYQRLAFLAPTDLAFGLARVYQAYVGAQYDEDSLRVFRRKDEAWQWLVEDKALAIQVGRRDR